MSSHLGRLRARPRTPIITQSCRWLGREARVTERADGRKVLPCLCHHGSTANAELPGRTARLVGNVDALAASVVTLPVLQAEMLPLNERALRKAARTTTRAGGKVVMPCTVYPGTGSGPAPSGPP